MPLAVSVMIAVLVVAAGAAPVTVERGALALEASLAKRTFATGEPVRMTLVVRNTGSTPLTVTFTSGQRADFIVRRPRGDEVWRWSHDKAFTMAIQTAVLRPREAVTISEEWNQRDLQGLRVDPGAYEVVAVFLGRVGDGQAPVRLPPLAFVIAK